MTLEYIRRWFERLPEHERDLPLVIHEGVAYSPRAILMEVERGTPLGEILQRKVETGSLGTTEEELEALAMARLEEILKRYPPDKPIVASLTVPPRVYTARELLEEIRRKTRVGRRLIEAEKRRAEKLVRLRPW